MDHRLDLQFAVDRSQFRIHPFTGNPIDRLSIFLRLRLITKIKQKLTALLLIEGPALGLHLLRICSPQLLKQSLLLLIQKTNDPDPDHIREVLDELCRHGIPIIIVLPVDLLR